MKKCPPGVICIENVTMFIFLIIFLIFIYLFHFKTQINIDNKPILDTQIHQSKNIYKNILILRYRTIIY